jgi:hypothetical protein
MLAYTRSNAALHHALPLGAEEGQHAVICGESSSLGQIALLRLSADQTLRLVYPSLGPEQWQALTLRWRSKLAS